ncbi:MAG: inactive transglutaminase family protein [Desulfomonile sp.]|nr:inactive transglutaminase family protein [Desulfomonile sp.]
MSKLHLYVLAGTLAVVGLGIFFYKTLFLGFPLSPKTTANVWNVEVRVKFIAKGKPVKLSVLIPSSTRSFAIADEQFVSAGYGLVATREEGNRVATWSIRTASGPQSVYYQAVIRAVKTKDPAATQKPPVVTPPVLDEPTLEATKALLAEIKAKSADTHSLVGTLIKKVNDPAPDDNVKVLLGPKPTISKKVETVVSVLQYGGIPARQANGIRLQEGKYDFSKKVPLLQWIEVFDRNKWQSFTPITGESPVPEDWFRWWTGSKKLVNLDGATSMSVVFSVTPKVEEAIVAAVRSAEISKPFLVKFSLFGLPLNTQAVYRVMLLVPVGAFILVLLRNLVGIKTFGTFMPVLIALSFRETGLLRGIFLFVVLVALGLSVRFYLERLKLLVVPRLAAVLIVVVGLMAIMSIVTHNLGGHTGLSVALFPMVIMTMTIERMSILWEERGATEALISGLGSIVTAAMAFLVINIKLVEHLAFVFPELLLVLLAGTLLVGGYAGFRLTDLYRFRELAKG